jgi:catechol 2,3-dioxygenase-like lactoylglutathione lyase family enzyme
MLNDATVSATIAVKSLDAAKNFYNNTLGLKPKEQNPGGLAYDCGGGKLFVYESGTAGSGKATCASWTVKDIDAVVSELKGKGVKFEHYDMPGATVENDVHIMGPMKAAWFKDPDGNILGLNNEG